MKTSIKKLSPTLPGEILRDSERFWLNLQSRYDIEVTKGARPN